MDITRRCDYAFRILRAAYENDGHCRSVSEIAEKEAIPYAFARSIQHDLVKGGLVKTVRGARGGMMLDCDPNQTTLLDVLRVVEGGPVNIASCTADPDSCAKQGACAFNRVWAGADKLLNDYFASITLASILDQGECHPAIEAAMAGQPAPSVAALGQQPCEGAC